MFNSMAITVTLFTAINLVQLPHEIIITIHVLYIIYGHWHKEITHFSPISEASYPSSTYVVTRTWCTHKLQMHCLNPWSDKNTCCQSFFFNVRENWSFQATKNVFNTAHNMKEKQTQTWCRRQFYDLLVINKLDCLVYFNSKFSTILKIVFWSTNLRICSHSDHYIYHRNTNFWIIFKTPSFINMSISQNLT